MAGYSAFQNSPVTSQAVVTVNAGFDRLFCTYRKELNDTDKDARYVSADDACFTVQVREPVFRLTDSLNSLAGLNRPEYTNGVNDMALKVFSSANNFPSATVISSTMPRGRMLPSQRDHILRSSLIFVGVAVTPVDYQNKNQKDNLAVQVSGSVTILNTGEHRIRPGQKIVWDLPQDRTTAGSKRKYHTTGPQDKHMFVVQPLEAAYNGPGNQRNFDFLTALHQTAPHATPALAAAALAKEDAQMLSGAMQGFADADDDERKKDMLINYARKLLVLYEETRSRVIGIALSGADPGQRFDIMLTTSH
jgi:hypothetical protein